MEGTGFVKISEKPNKMKSNREIREMQRNIRNMMLAGAGAIAMFTYASYIYISNPGHVLGDHETTIQETQVKPMAYQPVYTDIMPASEAPAPAAETVAEVPAKEKAPAAAKKAIVEEIQSFEVTCNNGTVVFSWVTEGQGKYAYEIEKSVDAQNFEVFSRAPQPEKKDGLSYYFVEESVDASEEAVYRLRRVVGKNKFEYTEPVAVKCNKKAAKEVAVDVFPAGYGAFRVLVNSPTEDNFNVVLTDASENILENKTFSAVQGSNEFIVKSDLIIKGSYHLRISNGTMTKEKKVVVK